MDKSTRIKFEQEGYLNLSTKLYDFPDFKILPPEIQDECFRVWIESLFLMVHGHLVRAHFTKTLRASDAAIEALFANGFYRCEIVYSLTSDKQWEYIYPAHSDLWRLHRSTVRTPISKVRRMSIFERDNFTCLHCGTNEKLTIDHIVPWVKGGGNEMENLQTLCQSCNSRKGVK